MCIMNDEKLSKTVEEMIGELSGSEYIQYMFDRTDENGIVYLEEFWRTPIGYYGDETKAIRCHVNWNVDKFEKLTEKFEKLYTAFKKIAEFDNELDDTEETAKKVLKNDSLFKIWQKYLAPFKAEGIDTERVQKIYDKIDMQQCVKDIASEIADGKNVDEFEKNILVDNIDTNVTQEEKDYYNGYCEAIYSECEKRIGKNICAYDLVMVSRTLTKLLAIKAPEIIVKCEARFFAQALLLNEYGKSMESVDYQLRLNIERLELMDDDELDEMFRPKKTNTRKSIAPLFVYFILKENTNVKKHFHQKDILKELSKYPYEITLERKALGRIIHNLVDSQLSVKADKTGVWIEQNA